MVRIQQRFRYVGLFGFSLQKNVHQYDYECNFSSFWQLWIRVADGELQDNTRADLFEYIVDFLCTSSNLDLVWKYADWALRKDPTVRYY